MTSGSRTLGLVTALVALCGGGGVVSGSSIDRGVIRAALERHRAEVRTCYERGLASDASLHLSLRLVLTIEASGVVRDAQVLPASDQEATALMQSVAACIAARARTWKMPSGPAGPIKINYPYRLVTNQKR